MTERGGLPDLAELSQHPERLAEIAPDQLPALLALLASLQSLISARLLSVDGGKPPAEEPDELLTVEEAASRLKVSTDWLYRHAARLPFAVKLGARQLRFSARGIGNYLCSRKGFRA